MAIRSLKTGSLSRSAQAGNTMIFPNSYESIATTTVGAGGTSTITFSYIPNTYTHLQIRLFGQTNRGTYGGDNFYMRVGASTVDNGSNYSWHMLYGDGGTTGVGGGSSATYINVLSGGCLGTTAGGSFGGVVVDLLDYANIFKFKTTCALGGTDDNGASAGGFGRAAGFNSGLWRNTSAIGIISLYPMNGTLFNAYTSAALYGIKE